ELPSRLDDGDEPVAGRQVHLAVGIYGRRTVPVRVRPLLIQLFSGLRVEANENAVFEAQIDESLVNERRGNVWRAGVFPQQKFGRIGDVSLAVRLEGEKLSA